MTRTMTVAQLSQYLKGVFDDEELLHDVMLSGEVIEVSYSDRHTFVTLAENEYSIRCVRFNSRDDIARGAKIALRGSVRFYDRRSSISFAYTDFYVCGVGSKNIEFNKLKEKLRIAGYFENRPKLPKYITKVVVISSKDGAAIRDFVRVATDKCPFIDIKLYPVKVQGDDAAAGMTKALKDLDGYPCDAIVLCRGGGSDEDLAAFNDEALATATALSTTPIISAVGHEVDYTLCDFCAGTRAGTPSIAGEIAGSRGAALFNDLLYLCDEASNAISSKFAAEKVRLDRLGLRIASAVEKKTARERNKLNVVKGAMTSALDDKLSVGKRMITDLCESVCNSVDERMRKYRERLEKLTAVLGALDPTKIKNGYALVTKNGKSISSASQLSKNDVIELKFSDGSVAAAITE